MVSVESGDICSKHTRTLKTLWIIQPTANANQQCLQQIPLPTPFQPQQIPLSSPMPVINGSMSVSEDQANHASQESS